MVNRCANQLSVIFVKAVIICSVITISVFSVNGVTCTFIILTSSSPSVSLHLIDIDTLNSCSITDSEVFSLFNVARPRKRLD